MYLVKFESILIDYFGGNNERFLKRLLKLSKIELIMFIIHTNELEYNTVEWAVYIKDILEKHQYKKQYDFYYPEMA